MLRVTEIFRSVQGESTHAGRPCAFVRLTGCPMRCTWCDSEYTFTGGEHVSVEDVMRQVRAYGCQLVEVTGGEPLAQKEALALIRRLCDEGFEVLIETGGFVSTEGVEEYELESRALAVLISPVWGETDLKELADLVSQSGLKNVRMQLQLHKYIWGPEVHGV